MGAPNAKVLANGTEQAACCHTWNANAGGAAGFHAPHGSTTSGAVGRRDPKRLLALPLSLMVLDTDLRGVGSGCANCRVARLERPPHTLVKKHVW